MIWSRQLQFRSDSSRREQKQLGLQAAEMAGLSDRRGRSQAGQPGKIYMWMLVPYLLGGYHFGSYW